MAEIELIPIGKIQESIYLIRGHKVMLDSDLAELYGVTTKRLNEQVKRNIDRFPEDFVFQLTEEEAEALRSQNATSNKGRGGQRYKPYVFTEHGAVMLASVLKSKVAIQASVYVVRAFVRLREMLATNKELAHKLSELEKRIDKHDEAIISLIKAIRGLMEPPPMKAKGRIGFNTKKSG